LFVSVAQTLLVIQKKRGLGARLADTPHYGDVIAE
jgi:hypothetical protein